MDKYQCFTELAACEERGKDYDFDIRLRTDSRVAIIAPHGGGIEPETSSIAEQISEVGFSLYCFKGLKPRGNRDLHITSHNFDEPECLALVANHEWVVAIHGCAEVGERVLLGGLDKALIADLSAALTEAGIPAETTGHSYAGEHQRNICNRGLRNAGVQFEISLPFRRSIKVLLFVKVVQSVLVRQNNAA